MNEERRQILQMLAEGKITPEQAEQLLEALGQEREPTESAEPQGTKKSTLGGLDLDKLIEMRAVGVTPEYIREIQALVGNIDLDKIIEMRAIGITPDFLRQWTQGGFEPLTQQEGQPPQEPFQWDWGHLRPPRQREQFDE